MRLLTSTKSIWEAVRDSNSSFTICVINVCDQIYDIYTELIRLSGATNVFYSYFHIFFILLKVVNTDNGTFYFTYDK